MAKKILFVVSSADRIGPNNRITGNLLTEVAHPYELFDKQGYQIDIFSIKGGVAPIEIFEADDPINVEFLNGEGAKKMKNTQRVDEIRVSDYDAVFIPGGLAPVVDMPDNTIVQQIISEMYSQGGLVSAVCHGPVSLLNVMLSDGAYLITGKNVTGFSAAEEENYAKADVPFELEDALRSRNSNYSCAGPWEAYSIADGRLITGQNPASAAGVAEKVIQMLESN